MDVYMYMYINFICVYNAFGDGVHFIFKISFYTGIRFRSLERTCLPNFSSQLHFFPVVLTRSFICFARLFFLSFVSFSLLPFEFISKALSCAGFPLK